MNKITVIIADDHQIVRQGLRSILDADSRFTVLGEAADGAEAVEQVLQKKPNILLLDVQMPCMSGIEVCQRLKTSAPGTSIMILTAFFDRTLVDACLRAGAKGFLLKSSEDLRIEEQLVNISKGKTALDPDTAHVLVDFLVNRDPLPEIISPRELSILHLMGMGLTNKEISQRLNLSNNTIKGYVKTLMNKMAVRNRAEAVLQGKERGLL
jgi:DNA-binding NarL/FixJ family response regulator